MQCRIRNSKQHGAVLDFIFILSLWKCSSGVECSRWATDYPAGRPATATVESPAQPSPAQPSPSQVTRGEWRGAGLCDSVHSGPLQDAEASRVAYPSILGRFAHPAAGSIEGQIVHLSCTEQKWFVPTINTFLLAYFAVGIGILGWVVATEAKIDGSNVSVAMIDFDRDIEDISCRNEIVGCSFIS